MKKLKGFTLSEIIVVLAISGVVVLAAFEVILLLEKHMGSLRKSFNYKEEVEIVEYALLNDLNTHKGYYSYKEKTIYFYSPLDTVAYKLRDSVLMRKKDMLSDNIKEYCLFFEGDKVSDGCFDAVSIQFSCGTRKNNVFVAAPNDANIYYSKERTNGI